MAAITAVQKLTPAEGVDTIEGSAEAAGFVERLRTDGSIPWGPIVTVLASMLATLIVTVSLLSVPAFLMVAEISRVGASVDNIGADTQKETHLLKLEIDTLKLQVDSLNKQLATGE